MGIRETQVMGLKDEAREYLRRNSKWIDKETRCPRCNVLIESSSFQSARVYDSNGKDGMFDDGPSLSEYDMLDGKKIKEIVQCAPWSSGPCIFLCLEDSKGNKMFEWTEEEIDNHL